MTLVLCRRSLCISAVRSTVMSKSLEEYFVPPETVRGCKIVDRASFRRDFELPAIHLARANLCSTFLKKLAHACLKFPSIKSVLTEDIEAGKVSPVMGLPDYTSYVY